MTETAELIDLLERQNGWLPETAADRIRSLQEENDRLKSALKQVQGECDAALKDSDSWRHTGNIAAIVSSALSPTKEGEEK
jgi:predicted nuclease with TOPRIM domain